jgi:signal transduction histidine kinase
MAVPVAGGRVAAERRLPFWAGNLIVFGLLFVVVVVYSLWQTSHAKNVFLEHMNEHARLVAEMLHLHAEGAVFARNTTEEILETFLGNTARFIEYLDDVEPLTSDELTAFATEKGLAGIRIIRAGGQSVSGPAQWQTRADSPCAPSMRLRHAPREHLYLLAWPIAHDGGCIVVGIDATDIERLQNQLSLATLTDTLAKLPGICYAYSETENPTGFVSGVQQEICLELTGRTPTAEVRLHAGNADITVGMCTDYLVITLRQIWRDFFAFSAALALLGGLLSFVLYRLQARHLSQVRSYERQIARAREDASLGRAAGSIAHEIRNPLNALKMGLQRLQIEGAEITPDHRRLLGLMLDAVRRANQTVSGLLNYSRPLAPDKQPVRPDTVLQDIILLYGDQCRERSITIEQDISCRDTIPADPDLLHQALENLFKNAVEAQPAGGWISLQIARKAGACIIGIRNPGCSVSPGDLQSILEPYYTTKADGAGLGLSIVRRIVDAHGGRITVHSPQAGVIEVTLVLPAGEAYNSAGRT